MKNNSRTQIIGAGLALTALIVAGSAASAPLQGQVEDSQVLRVICSFLPYAPACNPSRTTPTPRTTGTPSTGTTRTDGRVRLREGLRTAPTGVPVFGAPATAPAQRPTDIPVFGAPGPEIRVDTTTTVKEPYMSGGGMQVTAPPPAGCGDGACIQPEVGDVQSLTAGQNFVWCPVDCEGKTPIAAQPAPLPNCPLLTCAAPPEGMRYAKGTISLDANGCQTSCGELEKIVEVSQDCNGICEREDVPPVCPPGASCVSPDLLPPGRCPADCPVTRPAAQPAPTLVPIALPTPGPVTAPPACKMTIDDCVPPKGKQYRFVTDQYGCITSCGELEWISKLKELACDWSECKYEDRLTTVCAEGDHKSADPDCGRTSPGSPCEWLYPSCIDSDGDRKGDICGDGKVTLKEVCDEGSEKDKNGNSQRKDTPACRYCQVAAAYCGDGYKAASEACDDGNKIDNDGCDNGCNLPPVKPVCGNGKLEPLGGEACDDGNLIDTDGCTEQCQVDPSRQGTSKVCGGVAFTNAAKPIDETYLYKSVKFPFKESTTQKFEGYDPKCKTGKDWKIEAQTKFPGWTLCPFPANLDAGGCPNAPASTCGNSIVEKPYEDCDDGNRIGNDGCGPNCAFDTNTAPPAPKCGDGVHHWSEACDLGTRNGAKDSPCTAKCEIKYLCEPADCVGMTTPEKMWCTFSPQTTTGYSCNNDLDAETKIAQQLGIQPGTFGAKACKLQETSCSGGFFCGDGFQYFGFNEQCDFGMKDGRLVNVRGCNSCKKTACTDISYMPGLTEEKKKEILESNKRICGTSLCFGQQSEKGVCGCYSDSDCPADEPICDPQSQICRPKK